MEEAELLSLIRGKLFTAVLGDVMDTAGFRNQFLPPEIRPLQPETMLVGRAMPVLNIDLAADAGVADDGDVYGVMFRALDDLAPGEVYLAAGGSPAYALWGGLMSIRAAALGAAGTVLDGLHRDTTEIRRLGFPLFSRGAYGQDQRLRGKAVDFRCPVTFPNGTKVAPGDVIVGDIDGVLAIPAAELAATVAAAIAKIEGEEEVRRMIAGGETSASAFARTGIM